VEREREFEKPAGTTVEEETKEKSGLQGADFFLGCRFSKPHNPPTAPKRFFDLYNLDKINLTPDFEAWPTVPPGFPKAAICMRNADLLIGCGASREEAKEVIRANIASISWVDWNVRRVLA
jgi:iduronate 2-sulfatase